MEKRDSAAFLTIMFSTIQIAIIIGFIMRKDYFFVYDAVIVYFSYLIFIMFEKKRGIKLENYVRVLVMLTVTLHNLLGQFFDLYNHSKYFDSILHAFGTFSFALFFFAIINKTIRPYYHSKLFIFIFVASIGVCVGTLFEIIEFSIDIFFDTNNQRGLQDTNIDLLMDTMGAVIAGLYAAFHRAADYSNV